MSNVLKFPRTKIHRQSSNESAAHGLIKIEATEDGCDELSVSGLYAQRSEAAIYAVINALKLMADELAQTGMTGHTEIAPMLAELPQPPKRRMPPELLVDSNFAELR